MALENDLIGISCGALRLRCRANGPSHNRNAKTRARQMRRGMRQIVDAERQEIGSCLIPMEHGGEGSALLRVESGFLVVKILAGDHAKRDRRHALLVPNSPQLGDGPWVEALDGDWARGAPGALRDAMSQTKIAVEPTLDFTNERRATADEIDEGVQSERRVSAKAQPLAAVAALMTFPP